MLPLRFAKMAGAANDFIVFDNRNNQLPEINKQTIRRFCTRRFAIGADGLMILSSAPDADFHMQYFNADGSEAAMCGNGGRCIARFAVLINAGKEGQLLSFTAPSGRYTAQVTGNQVRLSIIPPEQFKQDICLKLKTGERCGDFTNTGVPHVVFFSDDLEAEDVLRCGREVRFHERFSPAGTNVNFCQVIDKYHLSLRTYERGVEDETMACGTGAAAAALLAARRGWVQSPVMVKTRSGVELQMEFVQNGAGFSEVYQRGEARLVYWGEIADAAMDFPLPEE